MNGSLTSQNITSKCLAITTDQAKSKGGNQQLSFKLLLHSDNLISSRLDTSR